MDSSVFEDPADSDAFSPEPKPVKAKAPPKKASTTTSKPATAPKKLTQSTLKKPAPQKRPKPDSDEENSDPDLNDDSLLPNSPPPAKKPKAAPKAPTVKKAAGKPLDEIDNEVHGDMDAKNGATVKPKPKKGTSTEQYQKLTQLEHILKRPDTYIGSVERTEQQMWVFNSETESMESRKVSYVPGLYKIFDEIIVNAADNKQRDKNMDEIRVHVNREQGVISVENNGRGIPVEIHEKEQIYIPEMIFGHLLTGSNYDDEEQKVVGGRNGYGAKLCNIFSKQFTLETQDSKTKQFYKQTWRNNMGDMGKAQITKAKGNDYTKITFAPDFRKFGMDEMDDDFEALVKRRVYDMAGTCSDVRVWLNGTRIKCRNFKTYMQMYTSAIQAEKPEALQNKDSQVILTDNPHERWEIGFAVSDGSFQQVSFVNGIATSSGGTHVNYVADQIADNLAAVVKKKNKGGVALRTNQIRNHIFLFVNCLINNPAFTSQTKEQLTTKPSQFGSKPQVSEKFLKDVAKTEAVQNIIHFAQAKADQMLKKSDGNRRTRMNNSKLTDANKAGTKDGHRCTLILTEGDSASLLALAGRAVVDPDLIGVFPLRGKILNVRDASIDQITKNAEIQNIKKFMGLQHKKHYDDTRSLRYGHLMIMTDQDHDGSHIKGLLINFLENSFPSLLKIRGFLQEFITPIVKVWKGDPKRPKKAQSFFTMPEYEAWKEVPGNQRGWDHKYYKGLGTSAPADAEVYFRDLDKHLKEFATLKNTGEINESDLIDLAFSKKRADNRKEWLREFRPGTYLDMSTAQITYTDFINKELILFSMADNMRSIPSVVDGFKPGQRKVLYTCFRRNLKKDIKVVELAGSVSGLTAYAYGEASLQGTIVALAQNFVGSNNINCLEPSGNFGSRLQGGQDSASARYIYTRLTSFARKIFNASDEPLLTYNMDDGKTIEPEVYSPIVPMILINGADGIGTGWSTTIPNFNPEDVVENLRLRMDGDSKDSMKPLKPWFRGWTNEVEDIGNGRFKFPGTIQQTGDNEVEITELPVRMWTQDFKDRLEEIIKAEKTPSFIKDYTEYNTPVKVHFIIKMDGDKHMNVAMERGLEETFKLSKTMATTNLVAFDSQSRIHKYDTVLDMMEEFYQYRLKMYNRRKTYMLAEMNQELEKLNNQARFIEMIISGKLVVNKKKKAALVSELREKGFKAIPKIVDAKKQGEFEPVVDEIDEEVAEDQAGSHDYDYLLGMAIWSLTQERIDKLRKQVGDKEEEITKLTKTSDKDLWRADLDDFITEWRTVLDEEAKHNKEMSRMGRRESKKLKIGANKGKKRKQADSEDDFASESDYAAPAKKAKANGKPTAVEIFDFGPAPVKREDKKKTVSKATAGLLGAVDQKPTSKPPAVTAGLIDDNSVSIISDDEFVDVKPSLTKAPAAAPAPKRKKKAVHDSSDEDEEGQALRKFQLESEAEKRKIDRKFQEDERAKQAKKAAQPAPKMSAGLTSAAPAAGPTAGRAARGAATKAVNYNVELDDSMEEVMDLGSKLKTYNSGSATGASKPLFRESASASRPSSSHSVTKQKTSRYREDDDDVDSTNWESLMPRGSPTKAAAKSAREATGFGDEDDSLLDIAIDQQKASVGLKAPTKPTAPPTKKLIEKPRKESTKPSALQQLEVKKTTKPLSPAAKAYEKKQQQAKKASGTASSSAPTAPTQPQFNKAKKSAPVPAPAAAAKGKGGKKKAVASESEDEDEDEDIVDELLSDDDDGDVAPVAPAVKTTGAGARPSRRAAATKARYVDDEEDEDSMMPDAAVGSVGQDEESEEDFDDDDDDDDD